jgi:hypothetical protein
MTTLALLVVLVVSLLVVPGTSNGRWCTNPSVALDTHYIARHDLT